MEYAASIKAHLLLIVRPREIKEGNVRLRNMKTGEERNVRKDKIANEATMILT